MSLFLDVQFLTEISYRLDKFARKGDYLFNCRCPLCGDSKTNANKTRGYFFKSKDHLNFKCHNCGASTTFSAILKQMDSTAYKRYCKEKFVHENVGKKTAPVKDPTRKKSAQMKEFEQRIDVRWPFIEPATTVPEAVAYLSERKIPERYHSLFYYVRETRHLNALADRYEGKWSHTEPRLLIPFYDMDRKLIGFNARALDPKYQRYVMAKVEPEGDMIFGLDRVDPSQEIFVVEGPFDSLFLHNAIAAGGTALDKALKYFEKDKITLVFDNQPRNKDVVKIIGKAVDDGFKVCIWPAMTVDKDINDMIRSGISADTIEDVIRGCTYRGLTAKMKFNDWRKTE